MTEQSNHGQFRSQGRKQEAGKIDQFDALKNLFDLSLDMLCVANLDGYFYAVNSAFETTLGHSKEVLLDTPFIEFVHPEDVASTLKAMAQLSTGEPVASFENRYRCKDGSYKWLAWTSVSVVGKGFLYAVARDVSLRKQADETLRKSEARLRALFESATDLIYIVDSDGLVIKANRQVYERLGYKEDEVIGAHINKFSCSCDFARLREHGYSRAEMDHAGKDGRVIHLDCSATAVPDENGEFTSFLVIQRDITERQRAEAELVISEQRFRTIFNSSYQLIGLLDPDGILLDANQTALDAAGLKKEDVVGRPFGDIYCWSYSADVQGRLIASIREASQGIPSRYEDDLLLEGNEIRTIDFTLKPVLNRQGEAALLIAEGRDVTDIKRAEEEARRHHQEIAHVIRLSTAGEMASGMAHELNQPLTALTGYCGAALSLLESMPTPPEQLNDILVRASEQAHRAGKIIRHLREFVSKGNDQWEHLNLDNVIHGVILFIKNEIQEHGATITFHPASEAVQVRIDKIQVEQVLVNLVRNSLEAISNANMSGGMITLQTRIMPSRFVEVTVADNGPGVNTDTASTLFDPFNTSKQAGMGIGLSISRTIIEAHGGRIWVDKDYRDGALFGFELPVSE